MPTPDTAAVDASANTASLTLDRAPYRAAIAIFAVVLAGYIWTLAPTVTFWDAGEFIAAAKILGIPHPPGTPLFVLLGNFFGRLLPFGEFAYRTNLMTAIFSAAAAAFMFLVVAQALKGWLAKERRVAGETDPWFAIGGAVAAAIISAFVFTVWQNSNETEVYMVATFSIAAISWLAWMWRRQRGTQRATHLLLLMVYIGAVSIGNHLLTLLVGPALVGYIWHVLRTEPLPDAADRRTEWAQWAVVTGVWALLIGAGLGSSDLLIVGGLAFAAVAIYAFAAGSYAFPLTVFAIGVVGVSTYAFLYFRAGLGPFINEADPSTWDALWSVIQRKQYPPRSPFDNPLYPSGPENPGRSLTIIGLQALNYVQYFDWQWANGLAPTDPVFARNTQLFGFIPVRLPFTLAFVSLGMAGLRELHRRDRSFFWFFLLLFLTAGPALMGYMNFKPGYSLGWDIFPQSVQHEVRERDYFFTLSFQIWGLFSGVGLAVLGRALRDSFKAATPKPDSRLPRHMERSRSLRRTTGGARAAMAGVLALAVVPFALNFRAASRAHTPTNTLARDFAYNLLQSVEPYGIVFTNGDNDTFPLWYLQEVEGVRQDVSVVNLSLGNTDWYIRQLRDNPVRPFDPDQAPWFASVAPDSAPGPLHTLSDQEIAGLYPQVLARASQVQIGRMTASFEAGTAMYVKDWLMLLLMSQNVGSRPVYYSITAGASNWLNLNEYLTNEALVIRVNAVEAPDTSRLVTGTLLGIPVDVPRTDSLVNYVYRYAGLFEADTLELDPTNRNIATNLSLPYLTLGQAFEVLGDRERSVESLRRGYHLAPNADLASLIQMLSQSAPTIPFGDTAIRVPEEQ